MRYGIAQETLRTVLTAGMRVRFSASDAEDLQLRLSIALHYHKTHLGQRTIQSDKSVVL